LAQLLAASKENTCKIEAYQRAAASFALPTQSLNRHKDAAFLNASLVGLGFAFRDAHA